MFELRLEDSAESENDLSSSISSLFSWLTGDVIRSGSWIPYTSGWGLGSLILAVVCLLMLGSIALLGK